jgi:gamma-glutamyltranspeptidase
MYIKTDKTYPMPQPIIDGLRRIGHEVRVLGGFSVVQAVAKERDGMLYGKADPRKGGWAAGF